SSYLLTPHSPAFSTSFCSISRSHRDLHSFPTRRSSDLSSTLTARRYTCIIKFYKFSGVHHNVFCLVDPICILQSKFFIYIFHNRSEEHTSELQSRFDLVCRLLLEKQQVKLNIQHLAHRQ